VVSDNVILKF